MIVCAHGCNGLVSKSCPTLATPWTVACQAPLSMGFPREEYWNGLPFPFPRDLPDPGVEPKSLALQAGSFTTASSGKPQFSFWSSPKTQEYRSLVSRQEILGYERWNISCHISEQRVSQSRAMTATMAAELVSPESAQEGKNTAI